MERQANPNSAAGPATTYVQADAHTFRDLVQRLTGAAPPAAGDSRPASAAAVAPRRSAFKLQDRRGPAVRNLEIQLGLSSSSSPRSHHRLLPTKSPMASPVTPLGSDPLFSPESEEERAIAEKGFYLHPSPRSAAAAHPPELLPLFPLRSPKQLQLKSEEGQRL